MCSIKRILQSFLLMTVLFIIVEIAYYHNISSFTNPSHNKVYNLNENQQSSAQHLPVPMEQESLDNNIDVIVGTIEHIITPNKLYMIKSSNGYFLTALINFDTKMQLSDTKPIDVGDKVKITYIKNQNNIFKDKSLVVSVNVREFSVYN